MLSKYIQSTNKRFYRHSHNTKEQLTVCCIYAVRRSFTWYIMRACTQLSVLFASSLFTFFVRFRMTVRIQIASKTFTTYVDALCIYLRMQTYTVWLTYITAHLYTNPLSIAEMITYWLLLIVRNGLEMIGSDNPNNITLFSKYEQLFFRILNTVSTIITDSKFIFVI